MHELIKIIKKVSLEAVEAAKPVNIIIGRIQKAEPLRVRIHQKLTLEKEFLVIPRHLAEEGFQKGEGVILLREQGGQRFVIIGKAGE